MMISSIRPALAVGAALLAAVLILFFGNRIKANLRSEERRVGKECGS